MNKSILIGRFVADPTIRYTQNNTAVASFTLAVDRRTKQEGQPTADFIPCVAWGKTAEFIKKFFKKGSKVAISGKIQTRSWEDADGKKNYVFEVIIDEAEFAESKREEEETSVEKNYGYIPLDEYSDI